MIYFCLRSNFRERTTLIGHDNLAKKLKYTDRNLMVENTIFPGKTEQLEISGS